jgi:DMSO/TMAO reductase YedYZ molybdopterin-dependent catalytic subunit
MNGACEVLVGQCDVEGGIELAGDVLCPMSISPRGLRLYQSKTVEPFDLHCIKTRKFIRRVDRYRGVPLRTLLDEAGLRSHSTTDFKRAVFLAVAHDGHSVTFSWHELFNSPVGEEALVAYECGGKPLSVEDGGPVLVSRADAYPALRHVNRLARIVARIVSA